VRAIATVAGWVMIAIGGFFAVAATLDLLTGQADATTRVEPGVLVGLVVLFGVVAFGGWRLTRWAAGGDARSRERRVLEAARAAGGLVTVAEVALRCELAVPEARAMLEGMARQGACEPRVTSDGEIVYAFEGFLSAAEKGEAKDPLEA
jgi:hypothetical protein